MIFRVTPSEIFYTIPTLEELVKAEEKVANLCRERLSAIWKEDAATHQKVSAWLEEELAKMRATRSAFHFLILRDIAICSREAAYPIVALGNLSGSVISFLLRVTEMAPFEYYTPEIVFGSDANPVTPDCTIGIAPQIRPLLQKYLDDRHGFAECNKELFRQLSLVDVDTCTRLGALLQGTHKNPTLCDIDYQICHRVANDILVEFFKEHGISGVFVEELNQPARWNLNSLLRLYAFTKAEFINGNNLKKLNASEFFVTREEFYHCLVQHDVPAETALDIVKGGVWSTGTKREKYIAILESYRVPEFVKDYFSKVQNLWAMASCVDRVLHKCYLAILLQNSNEFIKIVEKK